MDGAVMAAGTMGGTDKFELIRHPPPSSSLIEPDTVYGSCHRLWIRHDDAISRSCKGDETDALKMLALLPKYRSRSSILLYRAEGWF